MTKRHAGIFQCFVSNSLSKVDGGAATLEVIPRSKIFQPDATDTFSEQDGELIEEDEDFDLDEFLDPGASSAPSKPSVPSKGKGKKSKHRLKGTF